MEPINPSVWRRASRNTALSVSAVRIASGEYQACPPRVVVRGAARPALALNGMAGFQIKTGNASYLNQPHGTNR